MRAAGCHEPAKESDTRQRLCLHPLAIGYLRRCAIQGKALTSANYLEGKCDLRTLYASTPAAAPVLLPPMHATTLPDKSAPHAFDSWALSHTHIRRLPAGYMSQRKPSAIMTRPMISKCAPEYVGNCRWASFARDFSSPERVQKEECHLDG
jgi:hypothetical protein